MFHVADTIRTGGQFSDFPIYVRTSHHPLRRAGRQVSQAWLLAKMSYKDPISWEPAGTRLCTKGLTLELRATCVTLTGDFHLLVYSFSVLPLVSNQVSEWEISQLFLCLFLFYLFP